MLPKAIRGLFWDYRPNSINWEADPDLVISRILSDGDWEAISWLRQSLGDTRLRSWIETRRGRGLDARRLRFWEIVLDIPHRRVSAWLADPARQVWEHRSGR